jgi:predicted component of type VI protein secretion system
MSAFTKEDFLNPEIGQRLSVIIMSKMDKYVLLPFNKLKAKEKKTFNELLNQYIFSLGEDWREKLEKDFNEICCDELFDDANSFKPENINTVVGESELILTEERKQFEEDMKDPIKYNEWYEKLKADIIEQEQLVKQREEIKCLEEETHQ